MLLLNIVFVVDLGRAFCCVLEAYFVLVELFVIRHICCRWSILLCFGVVTIYRVLNKLFLGVTVCLLFVVFYLYS